MRQVWLCAATLVAAVSGLAEAQVRSVAEQDSLAWLQRIGAASQSLNFSGVFVYQSRGRVETSRITHLMEGSGGDREKLETLDGAPREVVRSQGEVQCYLPADKLLIIDRMPSRRFPSRFFATLRGLETHYKIRLGSVERVAGYEAQSVHLEPRDEYRFGLQLWAGVESGLLLKARMLDERGEVIEQFAFTDVTIGGDIDRERVKAMPRDPNVNIVRAQGVEPRADEINWAFRNLPPGYRQLSWTRRPLKQGGPDAYHAVFTDGIATVSVFFENASARQDVAALNGARSGAIAIYRRLLGDQVLTALGEVPAATLKRIADGAEFVRR